MFRLIPKLPLRGDTITTTSVLKLSASTFARRQLATMSSESTTPMEDSIRRKVSESLDPASLEVFNDSHLHSHHKAMIGTTSKETHFRLAITSSKFEGMNQLARHRMVNALLKDELAQEGGIHALQLRTKTPAEDEKMKEDAAAASTGSKIHN